MNVLLKITVLEPSGTEVASEILERGTSLALPVGERELILEEIVRDEREEKR